MTPDIRTVRTQKRQNRGLQSGSCLPRTLQEGFSTGSRVINEVVLEGGFCELCVDRVLRSLLPEIVTWQMYRPSEPASVSAGPVFTLHKGDGILTKTSVLGGG